MRSAVAGRLRRRLEGEVRRAMVRVGDWAHVALPALGRWVYERTRPAGDVGKPAPEAARPRQPAPDPEPEPATGATGPLPALVVPTEGPLDARVDAFLHVLRGATGAFVAFVADDQGLPIGATSSSEDSIAVTAAIDRALAPVRSTLRGDPLGSLALEVERDNVLQAVWFRAGGERYVLGLVLPEALGGDVVEQIRTAITELFSTSIREPSP